MATSTHVQPQLGQEDMSREFSLGFNAIVKYMQASRGCAAPRRMQLPHRRAVRAQRCSCCCGCSCGCCCAHPPTALAAALRRRRRGSPLPPGLCALHHRARV